MFDLRYYYCCCCYYYYYYLLYIVVKRLREHCIGWWQDKACIYYYSTMYDRCVANLFALCHICTLNLAVYKVHCDLYSLW